MEARREGCGRKRETNRMRERRSLGREKETQARARRKRNVTESRKEWKKKG